MHRLSPSASQAPSTRTAARLRVPGVFPIPALLVGLTAFATIAPFFFFHGTPSGHDFEFHMNSWMEVVSQWKEGIFYPRWASLAFWGYGEARFLFYPPASWMLGAALGAILPWRFVPDAYIWVALTFSGISMFALARRWVAPRDAIFAAMIYAANPYYLVIVYWRSAFAELLAGALLPLLLLFVLQLEKEGRSAMLALSIVVGAAWLTNGPAAVMVNYSLALMVVVLALTNRSPRVLLYGATAVVLGAALAAFYLVPAVYEEKWVNIAEVLSPGVRPQDNFLFTMLKDPDHNQFNHLISVVATAEIIAMTALLWFARRTRALRKDAWWVIAAWGSVASILVFRFTWFFWEYLPKLRFVQLPWRWLLCLNAALVVFAVVGIRRCFNRVVVYAALLLVIVSVWHRVLPPWWDEAPDIQELHDAVTSGQGYEGTDEYVPAGDDRYELNQNAPPVISQEAPAKIRLQKWGAQRKTFVAEVAQPTKLVLRLFDYPAWKVRVNGKPVWPSKTPITGQMVVPVPAGQSRVEIEFGRTWDRTLGGVVSIVAVLLLVAYVLWARNEVELA